MKKRICMCLALSLLLCFCAGCGQNNPTEGFTVGAEVPTDCENNQTVSNQNTQTDAPSDTQPSVTVEVIPPTAPENPGNSLVPFDPDREIFLLCEDQNFTIYNGYSGMPGFSVYIYSKNKLDVESISLTVSALSDYYVSVKELPLGAVATGTQYASVGVNEFPHALYQCYMGKDFANLWKLEQAMDAAYEAYHVKQEISYEEYEAAQKAYYNYRDAELESYRLLTRDDLPEFYVYCVNVGFFGGNFVDEIITDAELCIGEQTHVFTIGEIHLCTGEPDFPAELDWYNGAGGATDGILGSGNSPLPYNDGLHRIYNYFSFGVTKAMSLTDLVLDNPNHMLEAVWIDVAYGGGDSECFLWDRSEPFLLLPGDRVQIHIAYRDETATSLSYSTKVWGFLVYEWDGGMNCKLSECDIKTPAYTNFYELYAIIFDGLDLESYYRDYYYPKYEPWREEIS